MQEKLRKILNHYREEAQTKKYIEELSELMIAIIKGDIKNIKEEIADVKVMTKQVLMFENIDIEEYKKWKKHFKENERGMDSERTERFLEMQILIIQRCILIKDKYKTSSEIAALECLLDRYMDINNISKEEIEKEMERKINRQLERIEREKVNK